MNKNIILIYPKSRDIEFSYPVVPFSILFLGSFIKQKGYNPCLYDRRIQPLDKIITKIAADNILIIGMSVMTGPQIKYAYSDSKQIKEKFPNSIIVWGGVHPTFFPEQTLKEDCIDFLIKGEGEESLLEFLNELNRPNSCFAKIKNLVYTENQKIVVNDERPFMKNIDDIDLDWSLINVYNYINNRKKIEFITSRGCPFTCAFCYNQLFNRRQWRGWSTDKTCAEFQKIIDFGIKRIVFQDDNIATNKKRFLQITRFLGKNNITWKSEIRVDLGWTVELLKQLEQNGCEIIFVGAESGSQRVLDLIRKGTTVEQLLDFAKMIKATNITARYSWIVGFPTETRDEMFVTLKTIKKIRQILPESLHFVKVYTPYPGSELYKLAIEKGFQQPSDLIQWSDFTRENIKINYINNSKEIKGIVYSTFFGYTTPQSNDVNGIFKLAFLMLSILAKIRLRLMFFKFPYEFLAIEYYQKCTNWFKEKCM